jgi:hypothetical protein
MAHSLTASYHESWGDIAVVPPFAMEPYDSVWLMAQAMDLADSYTDGAAIVAALETIDIVLSQGRYHFAYGSHNPDLPEDTPTFMWHQWPDPIVVVMQYFEQDQIALDAAVIYPQVYQTHDTNYIEPGTSP